ncbi:MAG: hypothetical protein LBI94_08650 [Treponema sp.]|nr:hypothetical protein [Treponema sp.]
MEEAGYIEKPQNIIIETDVERKLSLNDLRKECLRYVREHFQGKAFTNKSTGREIKVSREGIGEWKMKSKTREQIVSIKILDQLLENSTFDHDFPDEKGRQNIENFSYFTSRCMVNETPYMAIITVKTTKPYGDKYYHHYLDDIKIEPRSGAAPTLAG